MVARVEHRSKAENVMPPKHSARASPRKNKAPRTRAGVPGPHAAQQPDQERRFVDIDPWAVLLERLLEMPEEGDAASEPERRGTNDQLGAKRPAKKSKERRARK